MPMPVPTITPSGLFISTYNDCLSALQADYYGIYGADSQLNANDIDGQLLAIFAQAYFDLTQVIQDTYNNFGILTSQGAFLDNLVALNGISRAQATASTVSVTLTGQAQTIVNNGQIGDNLGLGTVWLLPAAVTIPNSGTVTVTATCATPGAVAAQANTLTQIITTTAGWQSVNNALDAVVGFPVISDTELQQNQQNSVYTSSDGFMSDIVHDVLQVTGVTKIEYINNVTSSVDIYGIPGHTFSLIISGSPAVADVANAIALSKPSGVGSYGFINYTIVDANGVPELISYSLAQPTRIDVVITVKKLASWQATTGLAIQNAIFNFVNSLTTGTSSYIAWLESVASLTGTSLQSSFVVTSVTQALHGGTQAPNDLTAIYYQNFYCNLGDVGVVLT